MPEIGQTLAHYKIVEKLGQGGMGVVFLANDLSLGRKVALKFLTQDLGQDPVAHKRLLLEAKFAAALDHLSICSIHCLRRYRSTAKSDWVFSVSFVKWAGRIPFGCSCVCARSSGGVSDFDFMRP